MFISRTDKSKNQNPFSTLGFIHKLIVTSSYTRIQHIGVKVWDNVRKAATPCLETHSEIKFRRIN